MWHFDFICFKLVLLRLGNYEGTLMIRLLIGLVLCGIAVPGFAEGLDTGDTAWILTSTALVLFMTIPGLSLFYAGLVRSKNVLSVLMQCFTISVSYTHLTLPTTPYV